MFAAGNSYNVYITIYGREQIEVSASLVPWVEGGDTNTDIEDDVVVEGEEDDDDEPQTPATTVNHTITVTGIDDATIEWSDAEGTYSGTGATVTAPAGTVINYTVTKDGYLPKSGELTVADGGNIEVVLTEAVTLTFVFATSDSDKLPEGATATIKIGDNTYTYVDNEGQGTAIDVAKDVAIEGIVVTVTNSDSSTVSKSYDVEATDLASDYSITLYYSDMQ